MPVLQLVERPGPEGYVLDAIESKVVVGVPAGPLHPEMAQPVSADSTELLALAAAAETLGLAVVRIELGDRSGREISEQGERLESTLVEFARGGNLDRAVASLEAVPRYYVHRVGFEDPETHAVVTCTRHGLISVQGPAIEQGPQLLRALLFGFQRVLGFDG